MSRHLAVVFAVGLIAATTPAAIAQEEPLEKQGGEPPERIDILAEPITDEPEYNQECIEEQEAAILFGEIVVCRERTGDENRLYDKETAERKHAERTMYHNDILAPDTAGPGIFRGKATVSGLCFVPPCPPPPAYIIDFDELPDTPVGSDADRLARGLAPRGNDYGPDGSVVIAREAGLQSNAAELGLPPPLATGDEEDGEVSPSGSASPEELP